MLYRETFISIKGVLREVRIREDPVPLGLIIFIMVEMNSQLIHKLMDQPIVIFNPIHNLN